MTASLAELVQVRSHLAAEVLDYLSDVAARAADVPSYYPKQLRSIELGHARFDEIRQTVRVIQDRAAFDEWVAAQRERSRLAGDDVENSVGSKGSDDAPDPRDPARSLGMSTRSDVHKRERPTSIPWDEHACERFPRAVILGDPGLGLVMADNGRPVRSHEQPEPDRRRHLAIREVMDDLANRPLAFPWREVEFGIAGAGQRFGHHRVSLLVAFDELTSDCDFHVRLVSPLGSHPGFRTAVRAGFLLRLGHDVKF